MKSYKYVKSKEHFINCIRATLRDYPPNCINILSGQQYIDLVYEAGLADKFTWAIKQDVGILGVDRIHEWIATQESRKWLISDELRIEARAEELPFTDDFIELCNSLNGKFGIYNFCYPHVANSFYIGKSSSNLGTRIISSYSQKHEKIQYVPAMVSVIELDQASAGIYELYYISKYMPDFNKKDRYPIPCDILLPPIKEFSKGITILKRE